MSLSEKVQEMVGFTPTYKRDEREKIRGEARRKATTMWFSSILDHHVQIEEAFARVKSATSAGTRAAAQEKLAVLLTGHSIAEEAIIYPFMKIETSSYDASHSYKEQSEAKMAMVALDQIKDKMSAEYTKKLEEIYNAVEHHMVEEERDYFPDLQDKAQAVENKKMSQHYQMEFERYTTDMEE